MNALVSPRLAFAQQTVLVTTKASGRGDLFQAEQTMLRAPRPCSRNFGKALVYSSNRVSAEAWDRKAAEVVINSVDPNERLANRIVPDDLRVLWVRVQPPP